MNRKSWTRFVTVLVVMVQLGCQSGYTEKNLVDGTEKRKGGWFQWKEPEKYPRAPYETEAAHDRRTSELLGHPRR